MTERDGHSSGSNGSSQPIKELAEFSIKHDPTLPGRVRRSIERRELLGDSLEFSMSMTLATFWEYLKFAVESIGESRGNLEDS